MAPGGSGVQRLLEIRPEIVGVLAADAQAQQPGGQVRLAWHGRAALDRRLDGAEARGVVDHLQRGAYGIGTLGPAVDFEGHAAPKPVMWSRAIA